MLFARMVPPSGTANRTRQRAGRRCLPAAVPCASIAAACELNGMGVENGDGGPRGEQLSAPDAKRGGVRFHFRALGPIKEAQLELSGLTILVGRNNTGKTMLATALYGFLTRWRDWEVVHRELSDNPALADALGFLRTAATRGIANRRVSLQDLHAERQILLDALAAAYSKRDLDRVLGAPLGTFADASLRVELPPPKVGRFVAQGFAVGDGSRFGIRLNGDVISVERVEDIRIDEGAPDLEPQEPAAGSDSPERTLRDLVQLYGVFVLPELKFWVTPRPAEAMAAVLFQRELDSSKDRIVEALQNPAVAEPEPALEGFLRSRASRYSLLVRDFIEFAREMPATNTYRNRVLQKGIAKITGGRYETDGHSIFFRSAKGAPDPFRIPLYLASASVRSLAGLHYAQTEGGFHEDLVLVDEPESALDTRNQIELARFLAHLVRRGTRVLLATHSDYLIKELNNLIMLSQDFEGKDVLIERLGYAPDDFLLREAVHAFVAENGGLTRCEVDAYGMNMPVFDETIDSINSAANALAARIAR